MEIKLYLRMLQRGWWIVALTTLAAVFSTLVFSYLATPIYAASARYIISPNPSYLGGEIDYNLIYSLDTLDKRSIITTYSEVLNSPRIYKETLSLLGLNESDLADYSYSAVVLPETNIIEFMVQGPDPELVVTLTTSMGQHAIEYVENLYQIYDMGLLDPADVPVEPISPQPLRDTGVALVVGVVLGSALALLRELFRAPIVNFMQKREIDETSNALKRSAFLDDLKEISFASTQDLCLCFVHVEGLRDYIDVLPQLTLENILRHITQVLRNPLRGNDLVGRWDNIDFSVLLSGTPGSAALNTMRRVQTALSIPIRLDFSGEEVNLSPVIGIAEYRIGDDADSFVKNTEWALDIAKKNQGIHLLKAKEVI